MRPNRTQIERKVDVGLAHRRDEIARQHADDFSHYPVDGYVSPYRVGIARKQPLPGGVRHHKDACRVGAELPTAEGRETAGGIVLTESTSACGRNTKSLKETGLDPGGFHRLWTVIAAIYGFAREILKRAEFLERPLPISDILDRAGAQRKGLLDLRGDPVRGDVQGRPRLGPGSRPGSRATP